ncbi:MAG: GTP-binding protein, partial [Bacteroidetes bacterium]
MPSKIVHIDKFRELYEFDPGSYSLEANKRTKVYEGSRRADGKAVWIRVNDGREINQQLFELEALKTLQYEHENLQAYLDYAIVRSRNFLNEEAHWLVSIEERLEGIPFTHWKKAGVSDKKVLDQVLVGLLKGLDYLHEEGIFHGNLIPENIFLQQLEGGYTPRLMNYGFTRLFDAKKTSSGNLFIGSSGYMSPEKIAANRKLPVLSNIDLWGFGVILYELVTGEAPFGSKQAGYSLARIFDNILHLRLSRSLKHIKQPYRELISRCLVLDPLKRAQSAAELLEILQPSPVLPSRQAAPQQKPRIKIVPRNREEARLPEQEEQAPHIQLEPRVHNYARVIVVGDVGVGKSTLVEKITGQKIEEQEQHFPGINITAFQCHYLGQQVQLNFWDFKDHPVMHHLQQFFLSENCIFLLVCNAREQADPSKLRHWLNIIKSYGADSPVILVANQFQESKQDMDEYLFLREFPSIRALVPTSAKTGEGMEKLMAEIKSAMGRLLYLQNPLPPNWLAVIERLQQAEDSFIEFSQYRKLCRKLGISEIEQETLASSLHYMGLMLYYYDQVSHQPTTVLEPDWIAQGVYSIFSYLSHERPVLAFEELRNILDPIEFPPEKHIEFIRLLRRFQLCFPIGEQQTQYLFPLFLPHEQPPYPWESKNDLLVEYHYDYLPKNLFPQLIVKLHGYKEAKDPFWRHGIVITEEDKRAEIIEMPEKKQIRLRISGKHAFDFLRDIHVKFEHIHLQYHGLRVQAGIPCNCQHCIHNGQPQLFDYHTIEKYLEMDRSGIECYKSGQRVNLASLIKLEEGKGKKASNPGLVSDWLHSVKSITQLKSILSSQSISPSGSSKESERQPQPLYGQGGATKRILFLASNPNHTA